MDPEHFERKLRDFMTSAGIKGEQLYFQGSVHTVEQAAKELNARPSDLVKSVVLLYGGQVLVAIVSGDDRASPLKVGKALGSPPPRMATAREVLKYTGYPAGGVPPFGYEAKVVIDSRVMDKAVVYGGGGSERSLLRIATAELSRATAAIVADVRETS